MNLPVDVVRFFINASKKNYCVDTNFMPLGSCTMKYNRKILEEIVEFRNYSKLHPLTINSGVLEVLLELENFIKELTGFTHISLWQQSGAHAEWVSMLMIKKLFNGKRNKVLIPELAHGTNFASANRAGFVVQYVKCREGMIDEADLKSKLDGVACLMVTYPNTLGSFEPDIEKVISHVHKAGGVVYLDGANFNSIIGRIKPANLGFDIMHLNLHKTFGVPHGSGGPGAGIVCANDILGRFIPNPRIIKENDEIRLYEEKESIGYVSPFFGNTSVCIKAWAYIKMLGDEIHKISTQALENANYLKKLLENDFKILTPQIAHEFVIEVEDAMGYAKALLDYGFYAPTVNFPLRNVLMIEPSETESNETLKKFAEALIEIKNKKLYLNNPPHKTPVKRVDEVFAARNLKIKDETSL